MTDKYTRLEVFEQIMSCVGNVWIWKYSPSMEFGCSNCPRPDFFDTIFSISNCKDTIIKHCSQSYFPILVNDNIGLCWMASADFINGKADAIYVIGPVHSAAFTENHLKYKLNQTGLTLSLKRQLIEELKQVPIVLYSSFLKYGTMLYYSIHDTHIQPQDIIIPLNNPNESLKEWQSEFFHGTWRKEQQLMKLVEDGNLNFISYLQDMTPTGTPGIMSLNDPIRQAKNEIIVLTTLCTRAAIRGGLPPETSYTISDYYIQKIEATLNQNEVYSLSAEILSTFISRVHQCKEWKKYSSAINECMNYIELHITAKLEIDNIADSLGYTGYYLSSKFKKETGNTLNDYIKSSKIEYAKFLLSTTQKTPSEISDELHFSSPSFFSATFKKYTNMTPTQYRENI